MRIRVLSILFMLLMWMSGDALACEVCNKQQPKVLQGITHGAGPQSNWDYVLVSAIAIFSIAALVYSIKCLIRPGESANDHIKRVIFKSYHHG